MTAQTRYGNKMQMLIDAPKNCGTISPQELEELGAELFVYEYGSEEIGEKITLYWAIEKDEDVIVVARFTHFGSPAGVAANDMAALLCRNKTVEKAVELNYKGLEYFLRDNPNLPALPDDERYNIVLSLDAIKQAAKSYLGENTESQCPCHDTPMNIESIKEAIKEYDIQNLKELTQYTKAGIYDQACLAPSKLFEERKVYLQDILKETHDEIEAERLAKMAPLDTPFAQMNLEQQIATLNKAIDDSVRQYLVMDGGNMEILDVKQNGQQIDVYIRYVGACSGCASSTTGTLFAIESALKEKVDENIRVLSV